MQLPVKTLARKALRTADALTLDGPGVAALKKRLTAWFAGNDSLQLRWEDRSQAEMRTLANVTRGDRYYGHLVSLVLDDRQQLHAYFGYSWSGSRQVKSWLPVGSIDELLVYFRLLRECIARKQGEQARDTKVRKLRGAAILARVRDWARLHRFDYAAHESKNVLSLSLRFDDRHVIEMTIPFATFDQMLPKIESSLPLVRELVEAGISTHLRPDYAKYLRGRKWVTHQSLGAAEARESE